MPSRNGAEKLASACGPRPNFCRPVQVKAMEAACSSLPSLSEMGATVFRVCSQAPLPPTGSEPGPFSGQTNSRNNALAAGRSEKPLTTMPCVSTSFGFFSFQLGGWLLA